MELPGLDQQRLREQPPALPRLAAACRQQVLLQAGSSLESAGQTTAALLGVPDNRGGSGGRSKKRKQPEGPAAAAMAAADAQQPGQQAGQGSAGPTAAERAFPPTFYCTTARQMRLLAFPPGCAEDAEAAEAAEAEAGAEGGAVSSVGAAALSAAPEGVVSTGTAAAAGAGASEAGDADRKRAAAGAALEEGDGGGSASTSIGPPSSAAVGAAAAGALPPGWVSTWQRPTSGGAEAEALVAVDCEMVITAQARRRQSRRGPGRRLGGSVAACQAPSCLLVDIEACSQGPMPGMQGGLHAWRGRVQRRPLSPPPLQSAGV